MRESSKAKTRNVDYIFLTCTVMLVIFGFFMDSSASFIYATGRFGDSYYFIKRHIVFLLLGTCGMFFFSHLNYVKLRKIIFPLFIFTVILLIATLIPGAGVKISGARRWLRMGLFNFQTSEFAKCILILFLANYYAKHAEMKDSFKRFIAVPVALVLALLLPIVFQPDFSTATLLFVIAGTLIFVAGARMIHMFYLALPFLAGMILMVIAKPYRLKRIMSFLNPWEDPGSSGFQIIQSFLAFYAGGFWGVGPGASRQKLLYLPEAHNDFIFAVIAEELGFLGVFVVITVFFVLIYRGVRIALRTEDPFGRLLVFGVVFMIAIQVILNIGVVLGLFPVTGLTLPFISYGGASLVLLMSFSGIVLNVSRTIR